MRGRLVQYSPFARYLLPMHHQTFRLSREPVMEPIERLLAVAGSQGWRVAVTELGQTWTLPEREVRTSEDEMSRMVLASTL